MITEHIRRILDLFDNGFKSMPDDYVVSVDLERARQELDEIEGRIADLEDALEEAKDPTPVST